MKRDNEGFLYPSIDEDICVNCNLCEKVCPVINVAEDKPKKQYAYLVQNKNEKIRIISIFPLTNAGIYDILISVIITIIDYKKKYYGDQKNLVSYTIKFNLKEKRRISL